MTEERKQAIIAALQDIYAGFEPSDVEPELTMFGLISHYNTTGQNTELIGGNWVVENCSEPLCSLLS